MNVFESRVLIFLLLEKGIIMWSGGYVNYFDFEDYFIKYIYIKLFLWIWIQRIYLVFNYILIDLDKN